MNPPEALTKAVRTFAEEAAAMLTDYPYALPLETHERWSWERGNDGFFRRTITNAPSFGSAIGWQKARDQLQSLYVRVGAQKELLADPHAGKQITKYGAEKVKWVELGGITSISWCRAHFVFSQRGGDHTGRTPLLV